MLLWGLMSMQARWTGCIDTRVPLGEQVPKEGRYHPRSRLLQGAIIGREPFRSMGPGRLVLRNGVLGSMN